MATVADLSQTGHIQADVEGKIYRSTYQLQSGIITDKSMSVCYVAMQSRKQDFFFSPSH